MATNYVLVHGAGAGNWIWDEVLTALNRHRSGYPVVHGSHLRQPAPTGQVVGDDLPGHGYRAHEDLSVITLDDYVDAVVQWIEGRRLNNVVLVGHSMAGMILPRVAARLNGRIKRIVLLSGLVPAPGRSAIATLPAVRRTAVTLRAALRGAGDKGFPPPHKLLAQTIICNGMAPRYAAVVIRRLTPFPMKPLTTPIPAEDMGSVPATYVVFTRDRVLPPGLQRRMARNLGSPEIVEMEGGHMSPLLLRGPEIAEILLRYA